MTGSEDDRLRPAVLNEYRDVRGWRQIAQDAEAETARLRANVPTHVYILQWCDWEETTIYGAHLNREDADAHFDREVAKSPTAVFCLLRVPLGEDTFNGERVREYEPEGRRR